MLELEFVQDIFDLKSGDVEYKFWNRNFEYYGCILDVHSFLSSVTASQLILEQTWVTYQVRDIDTCTAVRHVLVEWRGSRKWTDSCETLFSKFTLKFDPGWATTTLHHVLSCSFTINLALKSCDNSPYLYLFLFSRILVKLITCMLMLARLRLFSMFSESAQKCYTLAGVLIF